VKMLPGFVLLAFVISSRILFVFFKRSREAIRLRFNSNSIEIPCGFFGFETIF